MQRFNQKLVSHLSRLTRLYVISWGGSQLFLPFFIIVAFFKTLWVCLTKPVHIIYVADGLLSPLGLILKILTRKPVCVTIHGRDIAYPLPLYQAIVPKCLSHLDKIICVSQAIKTECLKRYVPEGHLTVIPNGISIEDFSSLSKEEARKLLEQRLNVGLDSRKIILSIGRLVPKKGIDRFIKEILPRIISHDPSVCYIVAGGGPLFSEIYALRENLKLENNIVLLGHITMDDILLQILYRSADVFVMPNVHVPGDFEGFGIVALEASAAGLPVVASGIEGILEAVKQGENGFLMNPDDCQAFARIVLELLNDGAYRAECGRKAVAFVRESYSWEKIAKRYSNAMEDIIRGHGHQA